MPKKASSMPLLLLCHTQKYKSCNVFAMSYTKYKSCNSDTDTKTGLLFIFDNCGISVDVCVISECYLTEPTDKLVAPCINNETNWSVSGTMSS